MKKCLLYSVELFHSRYDSHAVPPFQAENSYFQLVLMFFRQTLSVSPHHPPPPHTINYWTAAIPLPLCGIGRVTPLVAVIICHAIGSSDNLSCHWYTALLFSLPADVMSSAANSLLTQLPEDTKLQLTRERAASVRKFLLCNWAPRYQCCTHVIRGATTWKHY